VKTAEYCGLNRYRNEATTEPHSACDLVSECLREFGIDLDYKTVANISQKTDDIELTPPPLALHRLS
jgi:hypothetical protein